MKKIEIIHLSQETLFLCYLVSVRRVDIMNFFQFTMAQEIHDQLFLLNSSDKCPLVT